MSKIAGRLICREVFRVEILTVLDITQRNVKTFWSLKMGLKGCFKMSLGITTLRCVMSKKRADPIYTATDASSYVLHYFVL
jgi:hypothetical protein